MFDFEPLMTLVIALGELSVLGQFAQGQRRMARVAGGHFKGPGLQGQVLPGSTDWQWLRDDGTLEIDAQYLLALDGGGLIQVTNQGLRHGSPEVLAELAAGQPVDPSRYFYRSVLRFATAEPALAHLNRSIALAKAERRGGQAVFDVHSLR